ncbi:MAG: hypothetical protein M1838_004743 [Thelocarpon superellum]|nr:MAG: hypothetical protein M1838_004743 [Thelocarpon superellum]
MSSPTNLAMSPPQATPPSLPPKKRSSTSSTNNPSKRRKPSTPSVASASAHPLRQTSFPPEQSARIPGRSPSISSSVVGGSVRRGRKGKSNAPSTTGGSIVDDKTRAGSASVVDGRGGGTAGAEEEDEEDDADAEAGLMVADGERANDDQERQKLEILVGAFDADQSDRYSYFRRAKLHPPTVRKITNQTLSQSVSEVVVKTINGFTKVFIGELMEIAREVQGEWMAAEAGEPVPEKDRGPLLPDHLREALRRYKKHKEGGGAGLQGLSLVAMNGYPSATGGKRLFR